VDVLFLGPPLKKPQQATTVSSIDHLFPHRESISAPHGPTQTIRFMNALKARDGRYPQSITAQRKNRFQVSEAGWP
jgi:hypothetical protein